MKGSEIDDPGHLIGLKPRRFPNWGARQQPIKICPLCSIHSLIKNQLMWPPVNMANGQILRAQKKDSS